MNRVLQNRASRKRALCTAGVGVVVGATIVSCSFASAFASTPTSTPTPTASTTPSSTPSPAPSSSSTPSPAPSTSTPSPAPPSSSAPSGIPTPSARSLATIKAAGAAATSKRITALGAAITKVNGDTYLTSSNKSTILNTLNSDETAMTSLASKIAADTTLTQASADVKSIYTEYRVFAVALPQARLTSESDRLAGTALPKLTAAQAKLESALTGTFAAKSTPALVADLADMSTRITAAQSANASVAADALAITPVDFDSNHAVLSTIRNSEKTAVSDAKKARDDAKTVLAALHGGS
jgi:uncharacterized protein YdeI (BOF family)